MESDSDSTFSFVDYEYDPTEEKFLQLDNILQCLYNTGLLTDIECRKIMTQSPNVVRVRAEMYNVILSKETKVFQTILHELRNRVHPLQNPRILQRIFSFLNYSDFGKCKHVCPDWKQIFDLVMSSKYEEVDLEKWLLMKFQSKNDKIQTTKSLGRKDEKRAAAFQLMLALNPGNDEIMLEKLKIKKDVDKCSINFYFDTDNKIDILIANVMRNPVVLSNIFQFLTLANIKNCRTVCRSWNSVSESHLRKISTIKFNSNFKPINFVNVSKYLPLPALHYNAFMFREFFLTEELTQFFTKFGGNIRSLDLCLRKGISSCLSHTNNLTELHFKGAQLNRLNIIPKTDQEIMIPLSALHSIKSLYLRNTVIDVDVDKDWIRLTPVKVYLNNVYFFFRSIYPKITVNDYIDFTKATDVHVRGTSRQTQQFNWARDEVDAEKMCFTNINFVGCESSTSKVKYLKMFCQDAFSENSLISVKELLIEGGSNSFNALPKSIEKLAIYELDSILHQSEPIHLPNLKFLSYQIGGGFSLLSLFDGCPNLTDLEILGMNMMALGWLPRNIKKLKVQLYAGRFNVIDESTARHFDLDILILDCVSGVDLNHLNFVKLRPKVLVLTINGVYKDEDFVTFITKNNNMDKIFVQIQTPSQPCVFSRGQLRNIVDKESLYYEFTKGSGKAITSKEYFTLQKSLSVKSVMKEFWDSKEKELANRKREEFYAHFKAYAANRDSDVEPEFDSDSQNDSDE